MVPEHLVEQSSLHPLMLFLEVAQYGLANAKKDQYEDYGAEHFLIRYWGLGFRD